MKYGDDYAYARRALEGTWVEIEDSLAYVTKVCNRSGNVTVGQGGDYKTVPLDDINIAPVFNGYVNVQGKAIYVARLAKRQWRQGLTEENMALPRIFDSDGRRVLFSQCVNRKNYPSFPTAMSVLGMDLASSVAVHNNWAVSKDLLGLSLHYKGELVAYLDHATYEYIGEPTMTQSMKREWEEIKDVH